MRLLLLLFFRNKSPFVVLEYLSNVLLIFCPVFHSICFAGDKSLEKTVIVPFMEYTDGLYCDEYIKEIPGAYTAVTFLLFVIVNAFASTFERIKLLLINGRL